MSARTTLRSATAAAHDAVDAAFSGFDLADLSSYGRFLSAHARALPSVENALDTATGLPSFAPRSTLLQADLTALGLAMPPPLPFAAPDSQAAAFGALYVIEGSRLGGVMLAKRVPSTLPRAYLSAAHVSGGWRAFGEALDIAATSGGPGWIEQAIQAAEATFNLYAQAATEV